jgi:thioredoxin domain-containing protein 5
MKAFFALALVVCVAFAEVEVLTKDNFDEKTKEGVWLIKFFAPWCGHCKRLAPTWEELSKKTEGKFHVAEVDCTVQKELAQRFQIHGFPTIKYIKDGAAPEDVRVPRTVEAYLKYVKDIVGLENVPEEKKPDPEKFVPKPPEEGKVVKLTKDNFELTKKGAWLIKFFAPWCGHCKRLAPTWEELAKKTEGKFHVAEVDCTVETELAQRFQIRGYPTIKYIKDGADALDVNVPRTVEAYIKYAKEQAEAPAKKPTEKVEGVAADVLSLDDAAFEKIKKERPVMVKFFAPWCGHCKALAPTWTQFATKARLDKKPYAVAEVDCTAHQKLCGANGVQGYPTVKIFNPSGEPVEYEGDRTLDDLINFADKNAKGEKAAHSEL